MEADRLMPWNQLAILADTSYTDRHDRADGHGPVRALKPAVSWGQDSATTAIQHTGFPSVCARADGSLFMVVRRGTNHSAARDGGIWYTTSVDDGRTWATPVQLFAASGGVEYRDPCVSLSTDRTKLYLTYFKGSAATPGAGCFFRTSTTGGVSWSAEVRVDGSKAVAACSAPAVETSTGVLVIPFYGKDTAGLAWESVFVATSSNGGSTWAQNKIYDGVGVGTHLQEPWVSKKPGANNLVMTFRWGSNASIASGYTSLTTGLGWSAPSVVIAGTGRPATAWLSTGEIVMVYRDTNNAWMWTRMLLDPVTPTWTTAHLVQRGPTGGFWTYGQPLEVRPGVALTPFCEEAAGATPSKLYLTVIVRGGGRSPLGTIPSDRVAVASDYDVLEYATSFRDRTTLAPEWTTLTGALTISSEGYLQSAAADGTPDRAVLDLALPDVHIEADFYQSVQSGVGIVVRAVDVNNYLIFTSETGGADLRLYKVVAGAATLLTGSAALVPLDGWVRLSISVRRQLIECFRNGGIVLGYALAAGAEQTQFMTPTRHGVSLNSPVGGVHFCRRWVARS